MKELHFTIGPVQSFVAQARRTRDLWAGSFLLSWLSAHAMNCVINDCKGEIVFPNTAKDELLLAVSGRKDLAPIIGSLPNRFVALLSDEATPSVVAEAVHGAWSKLAHGVFDKYIKPVTPYGNETENIWNTQTSNFWEIAWAVGSDSALLDRRKNWRTHVPSAFQGEQCTMMADWQELSGFLRIRNRKEQDDFWTAVRVQNGISEMELGQNERLCSIAFIKRFFHSVSDDCIGWRVNVANWPGTPYMAAVPFLSKAMRESPEECNSYQRIVAESCSGAFRGEWMTQIASIKEFPYSSNPIRGLDGDFFYQSAISDSTSRIPGLGETDSAKRQTVLQALATLQEKVKCKASPYYAILLMDGDRLGKKLQDAKEKSPVISEALALFTRGVPACISEHDGVTVYAGGDDVLAILPLTKAIDAAVAVKKLYLEAFNSVDLDECIASTCTISAGIAFAHFAQPFTDVLREAHWLLDGVAKNPGHGDRNALAAGVYKSGSLHSLWISKWDKAENMSGLLSCLSQSQCDQGILSNSFLYRFRKIVQLLDDKPLRHIGEKYKVPSDLDLKAIIMADVVRSWGKQGHVSLNGPDGIILAAQEASEVADKILSVCSYGDSSKYFTPDGLFLARFIAHAEVN